MYYGPGCFGPPVVFFAPRLLLLVFRRARVERRRPHIRPDLSPCFEPVPFQELQNGAAISSLHVRLCICTCRVCRVANRPAAPRCEPGPFVMGQPAEMERKTDDEREFCWPLTLSPVLIGLSGAAAAVLASRLARLGRSSQLSKDPASCAPTRTLPEKTVDLVPSPMPTVNSTPSLLHLLRA